MCLSYSRSEENTFIKIILLTVQKPGRKTQGTQRHLPSQLRRNQVKNNDHKLGTLLAPMETVSFVFPIPVPMLPKASGNIDVTGNRTHCFLWASH